MRLKPTLTIAALAMLAATAIAVGPRRGHFDAAKAQPKERLQTAEAKSTNHSKAENPIFSLAQKKAAGIHEVVAPQAAAGSPLRVLGDGTKIYGSLIFSTDWTSAAYGIYSFPAGEYTKPVREVAVESYDANGGGAYLGNRYVWNSYVYTEEMGYTFSTFCKYDFDTGQFSKVTHGMLDVDFDQSQITCDMTYDPTTSTIYALSYIAVTLDEDGMLVKYYPALSVVDPDTGFVTPIARIPDMIALAANQSGELYAVSKGVDSKLYRFNKETADYTVVGSTGLNTNFIQSMAFDPVTDRLYWAAVLTNGRSGLYEVDVTSGAASKICDFAANEEYAGLYVPEPEIAAGAPAKVENFTASFEADSHSGSVSLTMPAKSYSGAALQGKLSLTLTVDGQTRLQQEYAAGAKVSLDLTLDEGIHNFTATVSNDAGSGPRIGMSRYVGLDAPAQVGALKVEKNARGEAVISWDAPEKGRNDGYIDPARITYKVVRNPGNYIVGQNLRATTLTDPVNAPTDNYSYQVTAYCDGREGIPAETESAVFGNGTTLPCKFDFATREQYKLFTVIDANGDFEPRYNWGGWLYAPDFASAQEEGPCAVYGFSPESAADDWLISPAFLVEQGKKYRLTYTMWTRGAKERLEVTAGPLNDIASQTAITPTTEYSHKERTVFTQDFTAASTGNYHVGFHITSVKKAFYLFITDIMVDEVPDDSAPAAVADLTVTPGAKGAYEATVAMTAPSATVGGAALQTLDRVDVYRGNATEACHSFPSPRAGSALSWTDTNPAEYGFNTYRVVAFSGGKAGAKAEATAFVGYDRPKAPTDVEVTVDGDDGQPVISWTAPTEGINGGYINPDELVYAIYRLGDEQAILSRNAKGTEFVDGNLDGKRMQYYVGYEVVPMSEAGEGDYALTEMIVFGDPYECPFQESFADRSVSSNPWLMYRIKGNDNLWGVFSQGSSPVCNPADLDGGLATFQSTYGRPGDEGRLVSPKLTVADMSAPVLSFYVYLNASEYALYGDELFADRLIPEVILPDGEIRELGDAIYVDNTEGSGWLKFSYDISSLKKEKYFRLSFHGISDYGQDINLDLIRITNRIDNDLRLYTFTGPAMVHAGESATYSAAVYNGGANVATGYKMVLYSNGVKAQEFTGVPVSPGSYVNYEFTADFMPEDEGRTYSMQACIEWDADEIPANNKSDIMATRVTPPVLPEVYTLDVTTDEHEVRLGWTAPSALRVNDGFEDYAAFSIDNIGDYQLVDGDKGYTYGFSDIYFPNTGNRQSFMVFNPVSLGIVSKSPLFPDAFDPHGGNQVLACFQAVDAESGTSLKNDDWLISPEVFGGQTVRLWAKAGDVMQGVDMFELLYSTGDRSTQSFVPLSQVISTDENWTLHEFTLPQNARWFALHCVSDDAFVLFIDDLQFVGRRSESAVKHSGYRVYRDGSVLADLPAETLTYLDSNVPDGTHRYRVTALYEGNRESAPTEDAVVVIGESGTVEAVSDAPAVTVDGRTIIAVTPAEEAVTVAAVDGTVVYSGAGQSVHRVAVAPAVYVVTAGNRNYKVIVR